MIMKTFDRKTDPQRRPPDAINEAAAKVHDKEMSGEAAPLTFIKPLTQRL